MTATIPETSAEAPQEAAGGLPDGWTEVLQGSFSLYRGPAAIVVAWKAKGSNESRQLPPMPLAALNAQAAMFGKTADELLDELAAGGGK